MPNTRQRPTFGSKFVLHDGDGDQSFLSTPKTLKLVQADWFHAQLNFGPALLFVVQDGEFKGEFIALTARSMRNLAEQIHKTGLLSVIVHRITNAGKSFNPDTDILAVGMSHLERL
jgi:hypothetical protein